MEGIRIRRMWRWVKKRGVRGGCGKQGERLDGGKKGDRFERVRRERG